MFRGKFSFQIGKFKIVLSSRVLFIKERPAPYNGGCELGNVKIENFFFPSAQNLFENLRHRSVQSLYAGRNYSKTFSELIE